MADVIPVEIKTALIHGGFIAVTVPINEFHGITKGITKTAQDKTNTRMTLTVSENAFTQIQSKTVIKSKFAQPEDKSYKVGAYSSFGYSTVIFPLTEISSMTFQTNAVTITMTSMLWEKIVKAEKQETKEAFLKSLE